MINNIISRLMLGFFVCCLHHLSIAQEPPTVPSATERYEIGKEGRPVLLPVTIDGRTHQFLLDTGAAKTHFDIHFRSSLGPAIDIKTLKTPSGMQRESLFACPDAFVGSFPLHAVRTVGCTDLSYLRYVTGLEVEGILGADFCIGKQIIMNFDTGTVAINTRPEEERFSMRGNEIGIPVSIVAGVPQITVGLPEGKTTQVVIDTGASRTTLCAEVFDALIANENIEIFSTRRSVSLYGLQQCRFGRVSMLSLGDLQLPNVLLERDVLSLLALDQLSRFELCLDLQQNQLTIRNGKGFARPVADATSGMSIIQHTGKKVVVGVKQYGPAFNSGILTGDQLETVNGIAASELEMFELRRILTSGVGKTVELEVNRNQHLLPVSLKLSSMNDAERHR